MDSIIYEFQNRVKEFENKDLFIFLDIDSNVKDSYTYNQFDRRTDNIAQYISERLNPEIGDRVLLAYPAGLEMVCAFFACIKLGLVPVPVSPPKAQGFDSAIHKMNYIIEDCNASFVLSSRTYYWSFKVNLAKDSDCLKKSILKSIQNIKWIISDDTRAISNVNFEKKHSETLFLQYTSGSTNNPKGVIVTHKNILTNCNNVVDHLPIGVSWLPQYHDMGLIGYYIYFALKGGTTIGFSPTDFILRPALWLETITKYKCSASSAPNFAFQYCLVPGKIKEATLKNIDLSSLRFLMIAAEPINVNVYSKFLDKFKAYGLQEKSFFAAYGLAEFTLAVTNYGIKNESFTTASLKLNIAEVASNEIQRSQSIKIMSCGKPLGDTKVLIVDMLNNKPLKEEKRIGEIWIDGNSKCNGYWNKPVLSKNQFKAKSANDDSKKTWLRTGDIGFLYESELYISGRLKDLIIIRGLNYYPQDIESIIENNLDVRKSCVAAFSTPKENQELLTIVVGVKNNKKIPDAYQLNSEIVKHCGISANTILFVPARTIEKTSSGKIMRYRNKENFLLNKLQILHQVDLEEELLLELNLNIKDAEFHSLFKAYKIDLNENKSLGDLGFDSLKMVEFSSDLQNILHKKGFKELSKNIDLKLLQKIALSELFKILNELKPNAPLSKLKFKQVFNRIHKTFEKEEELLMKNDASIHQFWEDKTFDSNQNNIFLTGGTGFFGPFLIKSLLEQSKETIYVLVRSENIKKGMERLRKAFETIEPSNIILNSFEKRIVPVCGDLSSPKFGLTTQEWDFLSENIQTIYNNGAIVNYLLDYESMRNINVFGTNEILRLAANTRKKVLNHVSTTFIFGWSIKDTLFESDQNHEMELLDFGYSQTKWVSEQMVLNAKKKGLDVRIFRPALISPSAKGEGYNFDISIRLLAFMVKYGIGTFAQNQVSFTPADIAANNIIAISNIEESIGKTFHVTRDEYSNMEDITNILSRYTNQTFTNFSLSDFVPEVLSRCTKEDILFPLLNFLVKSVDNISTMEFKRYDNSNYVKFRDQSEWGIKDESLANVVFGIHKFMLKHELI